MGRSTEQKADITQNEKGDCLFLSTEALFKMHALPVKHACASLLMLQPQPFRCVLQGCNIAQILSHRAGTNVTFFFTKYTMNK